MSALAILSVIAATALAFFTHSSAVHAAAANVAYLCLGVAGGVAMTCVVLKSQGKKRNVAKPNTAHTNGQVEDIINQALTDGNSTYPGWHWETDRGGRLRAVSESLAAGVDQPAAHLLSLSFHEFPGARDPGSGWRRLAEAVESHKALSCTVKLPMFGTSSWWQVTVKPTTGRDGQPSGTMGVARDITRERTVLRSMSADLAAATRASRRKSRFLAAIATELRGPLNTVIGFTEHLRSASAIGEDPRDKRTHLDTILHSGTELQQIVSVLSDAARLERRQMKLVEQEADAAEVTEVAVKMCREVSERSNVSLVATLIDNIELRCDVNRLKQALMTLIAAAVAWSPAGTTVDINVDLPTGGGLIVEVAAKGANIVLAHPDELFEPYNWRTAAPLQSAGAAGLGLPIARQIAMLHAGDVTVEGAGGSGITFRLQLPASRVTLRPAQGSTINPAA
ncbi:MAG TPA: ATP-binding protein [Aestuariivirga sp.]|nr:ATP-binding protein [Aestuariivirga sp.]